MITCPFDRYVLFNIFLCNCFYLEPPGVISRLINTDRLATRIWSIRLALVQRLVTPRECGSCCLLL